MRFMVLPAMLLLSCASVPTDVDMSSSNPPQTVLNPPPGRILVGDSIITTGRPFLQMMEAPQSWTQLRELTDVLFYYD